MKTQLLILQNNSGYVRITPRQNDRVAVLSCKWTDGDWWYMAGEEIGRLSLGEKTAVLPLDGEISAAIERAGDVLCDTRSSAARWRMRIAEERAKERREIEPPVFASIVDGPPSEEPRPSRTPLDEIVEVQVDAPRAPTPPEDRLTGYPEVKALIDALPSTRFVRVQEDDSDYVLGLWYRDGAPYRVGYGVKGQKDRPLDGGELVSTQEGDYWIVWSPC